jgi:serine/threonine protein phosphatase PrpC
MMQYILAHARSSVRANGQGGTTTASIVVPVSIEGKRYALIGNAGDSPILMTPMPPKNDWINQEMAERQGKPDVPYQLSQDQSMSPPDGNVLWNAMDTEFDSSKDYIGVVPINGREKIIICSDGITGDNPHQYQAWNTFNAAMAKKDAKEVGRALIEGSKKDDDKSIVVIDFPR